MAVKVYRAPSPSTNEPVDEYADADVIDVKDDGHLYVIKRGPHVLAIYAPGHWVRTSSGV